MQDFRTLSCGQTLIRWRSMCTSFLHVFSSAREFDLRNQMVRAAISVPANIAEGCGRSGDREFRRFCRMALGSASELEYHLLLVRDLGLLPGPVYEPLGTQVVEVKRMLYGLIRSLGIHTEADSR